MDVDFPKRMLGDIITVLPRIVLIVNVFVDNELHLDRLVGNRLDSERNKLI